MATTLIAKIAARAKVIRGKSKTMTWQTALKKAGAELKGSTVKTTSKRRTTTKKVGQIALNKKGKPRKTLTKEMREYNKDVEQYKYFIVNIKTGRVDSGWEYKEDANDEFRDNEYDKNVFKIMTLPQMKKAGIKDPRKDYKYEIGATKYPKPKLFKPTPTQTKKAAQRLVKQSTPKIKKAAVDMDALNGIIKFQKNKFYEIIKGDNKGSVIKIVSITKSKTDINPLINNYDVDFYEYRNGVLQKPFEATISDRFLNKRSLRPRLSVKANEYKRYI